MNDINLAANTVPAQMRYVNTEWKHTDEIPRIGSRETRRANTSFHDIRVHDARPGLASGAITLERNGFTLSKNPTACPDFRDEATVEKVYYPEVERVVRETTGADHVFIRSHLIRTETPIDFNDGYARFVHCDYNMKRLKEFSEEVLTGLRLEGRADCADPVGVRHLDKGGLPAGRFYYRIIGGYKGASGPSRGGRGELPPCPQ